jgi:shikimate dehydrogenase
MAGAHPPAYRLGLIGWPVGHSLSPQLHAAALRAAGLAGTYHLFPLPPGPEGSQLLDDLLAEMRRGVLHGLNVTIPHKQSVLASLDELTPLAQATGAVNTICNRSGRLVGDNTDPPGFLADLERFLTDGSGSAPGVDSPTALVLGAGGSARAVAYALASSGWQVFLAARRREQAGQLASDLASAIGDPSPKISPLLLDPAALGEIALPGCLIVNCTPLGMVPQAEASPWPAGLAMPQHARVYDLVYNPPQTCLLRAARRAGLPCANGLGMLIEQAALAFERWTGVKASREAMRAAVAQPSLSDNEPVLKA